MIHRHADYTGSKRATMILDRWEEMAPKFVKVLPRDYARMLQSIERVKASGLTGDEALMAAFEENARDASRMGGG
jgi:glutamate synthase domain-containing protein 3